MNKLVGHPSLAIKADTSISTTVEADSFSNWNTAGEELAFISNLVNTVGEKVVNILFRGKHNIGVLVAVQLQSLAW